MVKKFFLYYIVDSLIDTIIKKVIASLATLRSKIHNNSILISIDNHTENNSTTAINENIIVTNNSTTTNTEIHTNRTDIINVETLSCTISYNLHTREMNIKLL